MRRAQYFVVPQACSRAAARFSHGRKDSHVSTVSEWLQHKKRRHEYRVVQKSPYDSLCYGRRCPTPSMAQVLLTRQPHGQIAMKAANKSSEKKAPDVFWPSPRAPDLSMLVMCGV